MFKVVEGGIYPTRGTKHSACVDLYANESLVIGAGETAIIDLGVQLDLDKLYKSWYHKTDNDPDRPSWKQFLNSHYLALELRSSMRAKGLLSGTGIIDLDYDKTLMLIVHNLSNKPFGISKGMRVAQTTLLKHKSALFDINSNTERNGGLGSTK